MDKELELQFEEAIELFDTQNYYEAILKFIELYQKNYKKEEILNILDEACYNPNLKEMKENFENNIDIFEKYPFVIGRNSCNFESLPYRLYMLNETEFYIFDLKTKEFTEIYKIYDESEYFLKEMNSELFFENEWNQYKLKFLNENVRKSEDIAMDNHIYLFYDSFFSLSKLFLTMDCSNLLEEQKFVFIVGKENKTYPIDFYKVFGIDYSCYEKTRLKVDDIKRIIFGWKITNASGTSFLADILDFHPNLLTIPDVLMSYYPKFYKENLNGKSVSEAISFLKNISDDDERKSFIMTILDHKNKEFSGEISSEKFLLSLENCLQEKKYPTAKEWLIGIYLAYSECHNREFYNRIIPAVFVYPHDDMYYISNINKEDINFYFNIILQFSWHKIISIIRDPIPHAGSVIRFMTTTHPRARDEDGNILMDPLYCMGFAVILPKDFYFVKEHPLYKDMGVVRFEDLKLNPKATLTSLAEFLNIPLTDSMYRTTKCGLVNKGIDTAGVLFEGFDPAPVYKTYTQYLSVFDKYRIELLLRHLFIDYGYHPRYYDNQEFSYEEILKMMELPFLCEEIKTLFSPEQKREIRQTFMMFVQMAVKSLPFAFNGGDDGIAPIPWIKPKEELIEHDIY